MLKPKEPVPLQPKNWPILQRAPRDDVSTHSCLDDEDLDELGLSSCKRKQLAEDIYSGFDRSWLE